MTFYLAFDPFNFAEHIILRLFRLEGYLHLLPITLQK
jgi:hypothetical protein